MAAWSSPISLRGIAGAMLIYGHGAPPSSAGNVGDGWIDVDSGRLYAVKGTGGWPSTYASLIGPKGDPGAGLVATSGKPADSTGVDGQYAIDPSTAFLWGPRTNGTWPSPPIALVGPPGPRGGSRQYVLDAGFYWATDGTFPTQMVGFNRSISDQNYTPAIMDAVIPMRTSGSVRSISGWCNGSTNGYAVNFALYKNGVATGATAQITATDKGSWSADFASGTYPFSIGDTLQLFIAAADASVDQSFSGFLTLDTSA